MAPGFLCISSAFAHRIQAGVDSAMDIAPFMDSIEDEAVSLIQSEVWRLESAKVNLNLLVTFKSFKPSVSSNHRTIDRAFQLPSQSLYEKFGGIRKFWKDQKEL